MRCSVFGIHTRGRTKSKGYCLGMLFNNNADRVVLDMQRLCVIRHTELTALERKGVNRFRFKFDLDSLL